MPVLAALTGTAAKADTNRTIANKTDTILLDFFITFFLSSFLCVFVICYVLSHISICLVKP